MKKVPGKEMIQTMHAAAIETECVAENVNCSLDHFFLLQSRFPGHGDMLSQFKLTFSNPLTSPRKLVTNTLSSCFHSYFEYHQFDNQD